MNGLGETDVGPALFGMVIASLLLTIVCAMFPFRVPVAAWFRRRFDTDLFLPSLGRKSAAANSTPGQIALVSVVGTPMAVIVFSRASSMFSQASSGSSGLVAFVVIAILAGCATLVFGAVTLLSRRVRRWFGGNTSGAIVGTVFVIVIVGAAAMIVGVLVGLP